MARVLVVGAYASRGSIPADGDKPAFDYDNTKVIVQVNFKKAQLKMDDKTRLSGATGNNVEVYNFGDSVEGMRNIHGMGVVLPCVLDVEFQPVKGGNEIVSITKVGK